MPMKPFRFAILLLAAISISACSQSSSQSAVELGRAAMQKNDFATAQKYFTQALQEAERGNAPPKEQLEILSSLSDLAKAQNQDMSVDMLQRAYKLSQQVNGVASEPTLAWNHTLADALYLDQNRRGEAEKLRLTSLEIEEKLFGKDNPLSMITLGKLVQPDCSGGKCQGDESMLNRYLELSVKHNGEAHLDTIKAFNLLAGFYQKKHDLAKAEPILKRSVKASSKLGPMQHAVALNALAWNLYHQDKFKEARTTLQEALTVESKQPDATYNAKAATLLLLTDVSESSKNWREAASSYKEFLALNEKSRAKDDPELPSLRRRYEELRAKAKG